jgi:hypothetical protein
VGAREERLAGNEALFREVNERVAEVADHFVEGATAESFTFTCECGSATCTEEIAMTLAEYEEVRTVPTHFAVVPGMICPRSRRWSSERRATSWSRSRKRTLRRLRARPIRELERLFLPVG